MRCVDLIAVDDDASLRGEDMDGLDLFSRAGSCVQRMRVHFYSRPEARAAEGNSARLGKFGSRARSLAWARMARFAPVGLQETSCRFPR